MTSQIPCKLRRRIKSAAYRWVSEHGTVTAETDPDYPPGKAWGYLSRALGRMATRREEGLFLRAWRDRVINDEYWED